MSNLVVVSCLRIGQRRVYEVTSGSRIPVPPANPGAAYDKAPYALLRQETKRMGP